MSLNGALQIGRSGMVASQAGIQVAGNNMANASTPGYTRQVVNLAPARGETIGRNQIIGRGVDLMQITRQVDVALQNRLRDAISQQQGSIIDQRFLASIEALQNELTDNDLSTLLSEFFNSFSELANTPLDNAVRTVVVQQGEILADRIQTLRGDYARVRDEVDRDLGTSVGQVNELLSRIEDVNFRIAQSEQGVAVANSLRDQRDQLLEELAQYMDISAIEQPNGAVDVLVGSLPIIVAGQSRGIELRTESKNGEIEVSVRISADKSELIIDSGRLGALLNQREQTINPAIDDLDAFASQLIFQVNKLHGQGQGTKGFNSTSGVYAIADPTANLNSTAANLPFRVENGSFFIHVTHDQSSTRTTHQITVDGDAMSLNDLINQINVTVGVPNVTASISVDGSLALNSSSGYSITFSDDTSGALASLGLNTYFTGRNATDIAVNQTLKDEPGLLAVGGGHVLGSNNTAVAIANLQDAALDDLNGSSLREFWQHSVNTTAVRASAAGRAVDAATLVRENIAGQLQAVSGVSMDEEAINLLSFQRQFQASARFISVIDEMIQTLLSIG